MDTTKAGYAIGGGALGRHGGLNNKGGAGKIIEPTHAHGLRGGPYILGISTAPSGDPALFIRRSVEENVFWNQQISDHVVFTRLLTPFWDEEIIRGLARFNGVFDRQRDMARNLRADPAAVAAFNLDSMGKVGQFTEFKRQLLASVASGRPTLAFPTFLDHISREEDYFVQTLARLNSGEPRPADRLMYEEHETFARLMAEHGRFIAHLLDPAESALIARANGYADRYDELLAAGRRAAGNNAALEELFNNDVALTTEYFDFKTIALALIQGGEILSIIHPRLALHVRREAGKFLEVLNGISMGQHE